MGVILVLSQKGSEKSSLSLVSFYLSRQLQESLDMADMHYDQYGTPLGYSSRGIDSDLTINE